MGHRRFTSVMLWSHGDMKKGWIVLLVVAAFVVSSVAHRVWRLSRVSVPGPMSSSFPPVEENRPPATEGFLFYVTTEDPDDGAYFLAPFDGSGLWRLVDNPEGMSLASTLEHNARSPYLAFVARTETGDTAIDLRERESGHIAYQHVITPKEWGTVNGGQATFVTESDDGSMLFFRNEGNTDGLVGAWSVNAVDGTVVRYDYLDKFAVRDVTFNPATKQLIGASYTGGTDEEPTGPSAVHLIDGVTGEGRELLADGAEAYVYPALSPDGAFYTWQRASGASNAVHVVDRETGKEIAVIDGRFVGWFGDTVLTEGLQLGYTFYNIKTKQRTTQPGFQYMVNDWRIKTGQPMDSLELTVQFLGGVDISDQTIAE